MVKRVLMVHNYYQQGGGEHTVFENEIRLLREHGVEVFTYTKDNSDLKRKPWKLLTLPLTTVWSQGTYRAVRRLIREHNIDVVHCHNTFPQISPSVYYAAWSCGVPVVQTIHNFRFACPNGLCFRDGHICEACLHGGLKNALRYGCYRNSRLQTLPVVLLLAVHRRLGTYKRLNCIFLTEFSRNKIASVLEMPREHTFVRGNFVGQNAAAQGREFVPNKFVFAGRLDDYKGVDWMLEQFARRPDLRLIVFGDGQRMEEAKRIASHCPNIELRGQRGHEEVLRELKSAAGLVFPSLLYEGFPMTIAESFACGTPVLCSNIGNGAELVRSTGGGALCEPNDASSFDIAAQSICSRREEFAANACQAAERWSAEPSWRELEKIYEVLEKHGDKKG